MVQYLFEPVCLSVSITAVTFVIHSCLINHGTVLYGTLGNATSVVPTTVTIQTTKPPTTTAVSVNGLLSRVRSHVIIQAL